MEALRVRPFWATFAVCATQYLTAVTFVCACVFSTQCVHGQYVMVPAQPYIQAAPVAGMPMGRMGGGRPMMQAQPSMSGSPSRGQSENFIVLCNDPALTEVVSKTAEKLRRDLAMHWLGEELPPWSQRCPIQVTAGARLGAGGETRFSLFDGNVGHWQMSVQGTPERILDSVLPHEITHTIFASYFAPLNTHVPRWADEGACTTVEHSSEQNKHKALLVECLKTKRGLSFNRMFSLKDYPSDILPLYAQGHSVVEFLLAQGGPRTFVKFLEAGMSTGRWETAIRNAYGYDTLGQLQTQWNQWIVDGRGDVAAYAGRPVRNNEPIPANDLEPQSEIALVSNQSMENVAPGNLQLASSAGLNSAVKDIVEEGEAVDLVVLRDSTAEMTRPRSVSSSGPSTNTTSGSSGFYRERLQTQLRDINRQSSQTRTATTSATPTPVPIEWKNPTGKPLQPIYR